MQRIWHWRGGVQRTWANLGGTIMGTAPMREVTTEEEIFSERYLRRGGRHGRYGCGGGAVRPLLLLGPSRPSSS